MRPSLIPLVLLLLAPFAAAGPAGAQPQNPDIQRAQPLDRLLPEIRRNQPGQFLDAEGITRNGMPGYRLKWLTPDGRVIERDVDARNGRTLGDGPERGMPQRDGFSRREESGPEAPRPRANFQSNFDEGRGDDPRARFGNRGFGSRSDFGTQERFNRAGAGDRGFGNPSERFGGRRFGPVGEGGAPGRRFGAGRARGNGGGE